MLLRIDVNPYISFGTVIFGDQFMTEATRGTQSTKSNILHVTLSAVTDSHTKLGVLNCGPSALCLYMQL